MFYTITGEFVNNKKKIIEQFSDEEKVNLISNENEDQGKILIPIYNSSSGSFGLKAESENDDIDRNDPFFTVKSKNGVKYLIAEKVQINNGSVINVSEVPNFKDFYRVILCFAPTRFAYGKTVSVFNIDYTYDDSESITADERILLSNEFISSIDKLIEDELIINNLNTSYLNSKIPLIKTEMEGAIDYGSDLTNDEKIRKKQAGNILLDMVLRYKMTFKTSSGEEVKVLDDVEAESTTGSTAVAASGDDVDSQVSDFADRYRQMRLDMCTQPEVFCPPGYKCISSDSWSTLLNNVDNLDSNLENMNILDGDN